MRRICVGDTGQAHEFEETPAVRGFHAGPTGVRAADTEFYNKGVRGRGINRKPHDLVVVLDSGVVRLQVDQERRGRIDRHGLWVHYSRVLGVTTRSVREQRERAQSIHPCKVVDCQGGVGNHCTSCAAVDSEALVDLGAYGRVSAWRIGVLALRGLHSIARLLTSTCCCSRRWRPLRRPTTLRPRQIQEQGVLRSLDPDSESETELILDPCDAVRVRIALHGKQHALSSEECQDRAAPEGTRLLEEDQALSDLGGSDTARLCSHHSQLYMLSCQGRKCSVVLATLPCGVPIGEPHFANATLPKQHEARRAKS